MIIRYGETEIIIVTTGVKQFILQLEKVEIILFFHNIFIVALMIK